MPKITVVFEYIEGAELPKKLTDAFASESSAFEGATITAISLDDEISRVEKLEAEVCTFGSADERVEKLIRLEENRPTSSAAISDIS